MKIVSRLLGKEIGATVALTCVAFLALMMFFDLIDINRGGVGYGIQKTVLYLFFETPRHLYDLLPICVLIATVFVLARYAQTSQFTIFRTAGLGPGKALSILFVLGVGFSLLTFAIGDYLAPWADRASQSMRVEHLGKLGWDTNKGAWLRDRQGTRQYIVSVHNVASDKHIEGVQIFEYNNHKSITRLIEANSALIASGEWLLQHVSINQFQSHQPNGQADTSQNIPPINTSEISLSAAQKLAETTPMSVHRSQAEEFSWSTNIDSKMLHASVLKPDGMSSLELLNYISHLKNNNQSARKYEIQLWRNVFYPLGCIVMMVLALPFAYLHFRSGSIMVYVFVGILVGISYLMLNNILGYMGNIHGWPPFLTSATPAALYSAVALVIFYYMVQKK